MADSISLSWICASNKNHDAQTRIMSEEHINDSQQAVGDAADNSEIILDETGDIVKPGPRGMANKNKETKLDKENVESNGK